MNKKEKKFYTYILLTERNTLYCGYTDDPQKRFELHKQGKGAKYTRANKPIKMVYLKEFPSKIEAQQEERRIKKLKRSEKEKLCTSLNWQTNS